MFVKLAVISCLVAAATAVWNGPLAGGVPAHQYPAGVSPQACPNFPNCANPAVAANPAAPAGHWGGQQAWQPQPAWNQHQPAWNAPAVPQWNPSSQNALDRGEYIGDGDYHGEGLAEALAPGYGGHNGQWNGDNNGQWNGDNGQWHGNNGQWNGGNNGQWNGGNNGQWNGGHNGGWNAGLPAGVSPHGQAQIPAGVDPHSCPNYPFCH